VPIITPALLEDPWRGREWQLFVERAQASGISRIVPVVWQPVENLPPTVAEIQLTDPGLPTSYLSRGLRAIAQAWDVIRRGKVIPRGASRDYEAIVRTLAERVVALGSDAEPVADDITIENLANAFDRPAPSVQNATMMNAVLEATQHLIWPEAAVDEDWAIVLGVGTYEHLPPLPDAEPRARAFASWLRDPDQGAMSNQRVKVLTSETAPDFEKALSVLLERQPRERIGRRLYLYGTGYGIGEIDSATLLLPSARHDRMWPALPLRQYADFLRVSGLFREVVLVADLTPAPSTAVPAAVAIPFQRPTLQSLADAFYAMALAAQGWGTLTQMFLEALNGAASDDGETVLASRLHLYLASAFHSREYPQPHFFQFGDIAFRRNTDPRVMLDLDFDESFAGAHAHVLTQDYEEFVSFAISSTTKVRVSRGVYFVQAGSESTRVEVSGPTVLSIVNTTSPKRVIVTGTGAYELTQAELWCSEATGRMLAEAGHWLITGGFQGVDHVAARSFADIVKSGGGNVADRLTHFVPDLRKASFAEGTVVRKKPGEDSIADEVSHAAAVIVIGGRGGSIQVANAAISRGIPVIPLPGTGGDAAAIFARLGGADSQLAAVSPDIRTQEDALAMARRVRHLLANIAERPKP
jgi:hypothetical protein